MEIEKLLDLINTDDAKFAKKSLDYLDGKQKDHVIAILNEPFSGRKDWKKKGMRPDLHRNLTKMIIEKSGLLFSDQPPVLNIFGDSSTVPNEDESIKFQNLLESVDWVEFFNNFDAVVRLMKTGIVLVQFDIETGSLVLDTLHRGNCAVMTNPNNKEVQLLVYHTYDIGDERGFRIFTKEKIEDYTVDKNKKIIKTGEAFNTYGCIPIAQFYDTNIPRTGFWATQPGDLIALNDMYNLHLIDSEYAASWAKLQTIVTNANIVGGNTDLMSVVEVAGQALPRQVPMEATIVGGPGKVVQIESPMGEAPYFEYKGADASNLMPIANMVDKWVRDFAADWSVRIKADGDGQADSGFKLIVEEMDNLDLRKRRAKMFEAGFKRLFRIIKQVMNSVAPGYFLEDTELFAKFPDPKLPVDKVSEESLWTTRINEGRATHVDYFMQVYGMSEQEALEKYKTIKEFYKAETETEPEPEQTLEAPEVPQEDPEVT